MDPSASTERKAPDAALVTDSPASPMRCSHRVSASISHAAPSPPVCAIWTSAPSVVALELCDGRREGAKASQPAGKNPISTSSMRASGASATSQQRQQHEPHEQNWQNPGRSPVGSSCPGALGRCSP